MVENEPIKSNLICEFSGALATTPVTWKIFGGPYQATESVLPIGSPPPKYLAAMDCVITTLLAALSAVLGSPLSKENEKTLKKAESAYKNRFSIYIWLPYF